MTDEYRLAHQHELPAVFELRARAFERGTGHDWAQYVEDDPWRDAGADLVAVADGEVVATLRVLDRRMAGVDGEQVRLAGIGAVASDPAVRGQGHVRKLLALAHERCRAAGYDLSMLFTGSPWVYRGSAGYSVLPMWVLDVDAARYASPVGDWTFAELDPSEHLRGMREVYEQFGRGRPGYPLRDDTYWTHPRAPMHARWSGLALDRHSRITAYLQVRLAMDGRAILMECPYLVADAVGVLVAALIRAAILPGGRMSGRLPRDHVLGQAGMWSVREDTMAHAYTSVGAHVLDVMRAPANELAVYWSADGF